MSRKQKIKADKPELEEIKQGFDLFDVKGTGKISPAELKESIETMNLAEKHPVIYDLLCKLDTPEVKKAGGITYDQLVEMIQEKMSDDKTKEGIKRLFDFFNVDPYSKTIPLSTFVKVAKELHEEATEEELKDLLEKANCSGDEITFDEFYEIMVKADYV